jgi:hypothetical protein
MSNKAEVLIKEALKTALIFCAKMLDFSIS